MAAPPALPSWSRRIIAELNATDQYAERLVRSLTLEQLNWRPAPQSWSIGQCLQHLFKANEVYLPAISASLENRPRSAVEEITPGWFGRWFIRTYIEPSPKSRRARAPRKADPGPQVEVSILESFLRSNEAARRLVYQASAYDVNRIRFRNPFVALIRFTVGTGLEITARHEIRHLLQAERVRQSRGFPG